MSVELCSLKSEFCWLKLLKSFKTFSRYIWLMMDVSLDIEWCYFEGVIITFIKFVVPKLKGVLRMNNCR